jgi:hypothetical protein
MRETDRSQRRGARSKRYGSLADFYRADPRRVQSRERDVGLWWREDVHGPLHRAAWVSDTGELYLVRLGPAEQGGGQVEVLATVAERERLESVLEGWRERCGEPRSLTWLRERAADLGDRARAAQAELAASLVGAGAMLATMAPLAWEIA